MASTFASVDKSFFVNLKSFPVKQCFPFTIDTSKYEKYLSKTIYAKTNTAQIDNDLYSLFNLKQSGTSTL